MKAFLYDTYGLKVFIPDINYMLFAYSISTTLLCFNIFLSPYHLLLYPTHFIINM